MRISISSAVRGNSPSRTPGGPRIFNRRIVLDMPGSSGDPEAIRRALERARDCETGSVDDHTTAILEAAIAELWSRINAAPQTYVPSPDEFALLNYFLERYRGSAVAQGAVRRFWDNYHGPPNVDGNKK